MPSRVSFFAILFLIAIALPPPAYSADVALHTLETLPELRRSSGYVLIGVDAGDTDSFLKIKRLDSRADRSEPLRSKFAVDDPAFRVNLAGKETGFYFMMLPVGFYQITEVSYPYYDLPFRLSTNKEREWRFFVAAEQVNYAGQLIVARERSESTLDVNLINRLAADYSTITERYGDLLTRFPLASGVGLRDDFLELLESP